MNELSSKLTWTFLEEIETPKIIKDLLLEDELVVSSYKTLRDTASFTNKRIIVIDSQGITGKKKEIYSLPYQSVNMWSTENAGTLDLNSEVELWTRAGNIKIKLGRQVDVRQFEGILARACL
ncbi:PH domain-containing protein [Atopobacter phocae]|uniref:PH domain-containing protein n=1 Tax=Atopobacter phocae TaxID=136492 RepID=UPI00046FDAC9|nr:PH domain-containing protein [Atopobacter phocae]